MSTENCYFYTAVKEGVLRVHPLCVECHNKNFPELGWFWAGSEKGYGNFLFKCEKCGKIIHAPEKEFEDD